MDTLSERYEKKNLKSSLHPKIQIYKASQGPLSPAAFFFFFNPSAVLPTIFAACNVIL